MLGEYTKTFSSEFAIRKFINDYPEKTFAKMLEWSLSEDTDQRRLASEGLRPKLPWSIKIDFDYREGIKPLENLFYDSERYVTRSVANHLNDISKIDPDLVVDVLKSWKKSKKQKDAEMNYVISHSCRTLIKKGHRGALELQGYKAESTFEVKDFRIEHPVISLGEYLEFSFHFKPDSDSKYMIDYIVDYPMASGKRSQKVFKIKKLNQVKDEILIKKKHQFKMMTTKTWYQGTYYIRLQINGKVIEQAAFQLNVGEH
jgi:3-methyladenine DNA glycosylase AlkC